MATQTKKVGPVEVQVEVQATPKATAAERLDMVLTLIGRETAKPVDSPDQVKWGKAIGLLGGGSVYINRGNADIRSTQKQVAEWAKTIKGSTVRGPQRQYLRVTF